MSAGIPIYLAVEDDLSEYVLRRALGARATRYDIGAVYSRGGFGYLKKQAAGFNNAAKACPFLLLTDLDQHECPPELIQQWLKHKRHRHFLLRVAVREVESWLLGDEEGLRLFLGLKKAQTLAVPESVQDPKVELLKLALKTRSRIMRDALVWHDTGSGRLYQGPDYNGTLAEFVMNHWDMAKARQRCPSLERLFTALDRLERNHTRS